MGQYTHHIQASYTATDADALIEALRRVPDQGMLITLGLPDTQKMIDFLEQAIAAEHIGAQIQWRTWLGWFRDHRDRLNGGDGRLLDHWPDDLIKFLLLAWFTLSLGDMRGQFTLAVADWTFQQYSGMCEILDIELV